MRDSRRPQGYIAPHNRLPNTPGRFRSPPVRNGKWRPHTSQSARSYEQRENRSFPRGGYNNRPPRRGQPKAIYRNPHWGGQTQNRGGATGWENTPKDVERGQEPQDQCAYRNQEMNGRTGRTQERERPIASTDRYQERGDALEGREGSRRKRQREY